MGEQLLRYQKSGFVPCFSSGNIASCFGGTLLARDELLQGPTPSTSAHHPQTSPSSSTWVTYLKTIFQLSSRAS